MTKIKKIGKISLIGLGIFIAFSVLMGILFGKSPEELATENAQKLELLKDEKKYINEINTILTDITEDMHSATLEISSSLKNNTFNHSELSLNYKPIVENLEKISNLRFKLSNDLNLSLGLNFKASLDTINNNLENIIKLTLDSLRDISNNNPDAGTQKILEANKQYDELNSELDNYLNLSTNILKEIDEKINELQL